MNSKLLVTGGAGYIGSHVIRQLLDAGYNVKVFDSLENGPHRIKTLKSLKMMCPTGSN